MKRGRESLTGGTGDVSPQFMSFSATQSAADTTTTATQQVPIQRLPTGQRAQVMEVLKVFFNLPLTAASASATEAVDSITAFLSTSSFGTTSTSFSEPRVVAAAKSNSRHAFTAGGTYYTVMPGIIVVDVTDGAGHGVLVATDNIFLQVVSATTGNANTVDVKVLYRWKNVSLQEYIGIVQSQQ